MGTENFNCSKCGGQMAKGFIADYSEASYFPTYWIEGEPVNRTLLGIQGSNLEVSGRNKYLIRSLRCEKCGFTELYSV
jgi:predicted nucleic-acid-binding Zn-ribbon protein